MPTPVPPDSEPEEATEPRGGFQKYRPIAEVARGEASIVYLAVVQGAESHRKLAAVRELRSDLTHDEAAVARFLEKARIAALLEHRSLVETLEFGGHGSRHFHAMEYVDGQALRAVIKRAQGRGVPMSLPMHLRLILDVLSAIEHVHSVASDGKALALVHRDLGPQRVVLTYEGYVKLVDLGITAAPDGRRGGCSDVSTVGSMLWEGVVMSRSRGGPRRGSPSSGEPRSDVDPELLAIVERAMDGNPAKRYQTVRALSAALEAHVATSKLVLPGASEIAALVSDLFSEERKKAQAIVASQLRILRDSGTALRPGMALPRLAPVSSPAVPRVDPTPVLPSVSRPRSATPDSLAPTAAPTAPPTAGVTASPRSPGPRPEPLPSASAAPIVPRWGGRARILAFAAVGVALSAAAPVVILLVSSRSAGGAPAEAPVSAAGRAAEVTASVLPVKMATTSHRIVRATPPSVRLFLDDSAVPNPYVADLPPDPAAHRIRAEAPGYAAEEETVTFDRDTVLHFALAAARPSAHVDPAPAVPARAPAPVATSPQIVRRAPPPQSEPRAASPPAAVAVAQAPGPAPPSPPPVSAPTSAIEAPRAKPDREIFTQNPYLQ
ncbi:MAG: protein kinase domain-containing protein [Polyangiaceae bacterium]